MGDETPTSVRVPDADDEVPCALADWEGSVNRCEDCGRETFGVCWYCNYRIRRDDIPLCPDEHVNNPTACKSVYEVRCMRRDDWPL